MVVAPGKGRYLALSGSRKRGYANERTAIDPAMYACGMKPQIAIDIVLQQVSALLGEPLRDGQASRYEPRPRSRCLDAGEQCMADRPPGTHVVPYHSDLGRRELVTCKPDPRLRTYIQSYQGYSERTTGLMRRLKPPSTTVVLIIGLGSALSVIDPRDQGLNDAAADYTSFVAGLKDSYVLIEARGIWQAGIQVNFTPLGAYQFLHLPMHQLANRVIALDDLLGLGARRLVERLRETPSWEARFALLDAFISTRLAEGRAPTAGITWAWHTLHKANGCLGIGALAAELGWSQKHLITQFHEQIGLPPKTLARILRFAHALRHLEHSNGVRWSEIALDCGYYDQAHFNRDFRAFTGRAPADFLARRLPDGGISGD